MKPEDKQIVLKLNFNVYTVYFCINYHLATISTCRCSDNLPFCRVIRHQYMR